MNGCVTVSAAATVIGDSGVPFGYLIGGLMVVIGLAGGVYGQVLRRRGRRPPR